MSNANIEPELTSLLSKLTIEIQNDSKEIEVRKKRIEKNESLLRAVRGSLGAIHPETKPIGYGAKTGVIREAIERIPKPQFLQDDIENELRRVMPSLEINRSRIRSALWTMAEKGEIKVIRRGTNKEPAHYEKVEGMARHTRPTQQGCEQSRVTADTPDLTPASFEEAVRTKSGRLEHLAKRLNTNKERLQDLLEPTSKVYMGSAGWLRVRE
jgi:hypothetical protein